MSLQGAELKAAIGNVLDGGLVQQAVASTEGGQSLGVIEKPTMSNSILTEAFPAAANSETYTAPAVDNVAKLEI